MRLQQRNNKLKTIFFLLLMICSSLFGFPKEELRQPKIILEDIKKQSSTPALYDELGTSYLAEGEIKKAQEAFSKAISLNSTFANSYYGLGKIEYTKKNFKKAEENLLIATALQPTSTQYLGLLGRIQMKLGLWNKAIITLKKAIAIKGKKSGYFYSLLSRCYDHTGNYKKSADCILQQIPSRPWDDTIYVRAAKKYYKAGEKKLGDKYKKLAGHTWYEYRHFKSNYAENSGWTAYQNKDYELAIQKFKSLPKSSENYFGIGLSYLKLQNFDNARTYFLKAITLKPKMGKAYNQLGNIAFQLSDFSQALQYYKKALRINPDDAYTLYSLSKLYIKEKKFDDAQKYLLILTKKNPDYASYWSTLGYVASRNKNLKLSFHAYYSAYINSRTEKERKKFLKKVINTGLTYAQKNANQKTEIAKKLLQITPKTNENYSILKKMAH